MSLVKSPTTLTRLSHSSGACSTICPSTTHVRVTIFYTKELGFVVAIMEQRYPGSSVSIRVENGQVFSSNDAVFPPQVSAKILAQIKDGSKVATRYVSWPEKANVDRVLDVYGASVAAAYIKWAFGQIK